MQLSLPPAGESGQEGSGIGAHGEGSYRIDLARSGPEIPRGRLWLRAAAFGIDLLLLAGLPLLTATAVVFGLLVASADPPAGIGGVFRVAQGVFVLSFLVRDAWGASPGKRILGLRTSVEPGRSPLLASVARNAPLLLPGWNLVEALLVLRRRQLRPGDRLGGTAVLEI